MGNDLISCIQHPTRLQLFAFSLLSMHNKAFQTIQNVYRIKYRHIRYKYMDKDKVCHTSYLIGVDLKGVNDN